MLRHHRGFDSAPPTTWPNLPDREGLEFEEVNAAPSPDDAFLGKSTMGKVPALETGAGCISESYAIADYLDHVKPEPALVGRLVVCDPYITALVTADPTGG